LTKDELDRFFTYHPPVHADIDKFTRIRREAYNLAHVIFQDAPDGRDRDLAIEKLREVVMWANAAIACAPLTARQALDAPEDCGGA